MGTRCRVVIHLVAPPLRHGGRLRLNVETNGDEQLHTAGAVAVHIIDAVGPGEHPGYQGHDFPTPDWLPC